MTRTGRAKARPVPYTVDCTVEHSGGTMRARNRRQRPQRPHLQGDTANARFERAVEESFAFLVRHYGFHQEECHTRDSEAWIMYSKREARIIVARDHASGCKVTLAGPRSADILDSE